MCRIATNKLKFRSYKLKMGHYLDDRMKRARLENVRRLLKIKDFKSVLFIDKKIFTSDKKHATIFSKVSRGLQGRAKGGNFEHLPK